MQNFQLVKKQFVQTDYRTYGDGKAQEVADQSSETFNEIMVYPDSEGLLMTIGKCATYNHNQFVHLSGIAAIYNKHTTEEFKMILENSISLLSIDTATEKFGVIIYPNPSIENKSTFLENAEALKIAVNELKLNVAQYVQI